MGKEEVPSPSMQCLTHNSHLKGKLQLCYAAASSNYRKTLKYFNTQSSSSGKISVKKLYDIFLPL